MHMAASVRETRAVHK